MFNFTYQNQQCCATSVAGHLFQCDFTKDCESWQVNELKLLDLQHVQYIPCKGAGQIMKQIQMLTLDQDREGENICFEVLSIIKFNMQNVYRMLFSSLSKQEITRAMNKLTKPDKNLSDSVAVRQELDLKVGVAFSRFQTKYFKAKYTNLNTQVVSYGPCQIPTLAFCVNRQDEILNFKPKQQFNIQIQLQNNIQLIHPQTFSEIGQAQEKLDQLKTIKEAKIIKINNTTKKIGKPQGLNTVQLLKLASERLHMSPAVALHAAEQLYLQGYTTYPRTESTSYPPSFNFKEITDQLSQNPEFAYVCTKLPKYFNPKKGVNAGDHPPITPTSKPYNGRDAMYSLICKCFLQSIMDDAEFQVQTCTLQIQNDTFQLKSKQYINEGWHAFLNKQNKQEYNDEDDYVTQTDFSKLKSLRISNMSIQTSYTKPPKPLTESQLLSLMEKNQIGTDASMATHIQNICDRNYVQVDNSTRSMIPTTLGISLIKGYKLIDQSLVSCKLRSQMELELNSVACGKISKQKMIEQQLAKYRQQFIIFTQKISMFDQIFANKFVKIEDAGKPFIQCGKCHKFMKLISDKNSFKLFCPTCQINCELPKSIQKPIVLENSYCDKCDQKLIYTIDQSKIHKVFCPICFNNGHQNCSQCFDKNCKYSNKNSVLGLCPICSKQSTNNTQQQDESDDIVIEISGQDENSTEINIDIEDQQDQTQKGMLYINNISTGNNTQIFCTNCGIGILFKQKFVLTQYKCNCGLYKVKNQQGQEYCLSCNLKDIEHESILPNQQQGRKQVNKRQNNNNKKHYKRNNHK